MDAAVLPDDKGEHGAAPVARSLRTLALPDEMESWSLTTIREKVGEIGPKVIALARYAVFQMAEVAVPSDLFVRVLGMYSAVRQGGWAANLGNPS